jgi:hypothetical protein
LYHCVTGCFNNDPVVVSFYHNTMTAKWREYPPLGHFTITILFDQHIISIHHVHEYQQPLVRDVFHNGLTSYLSSNGGEEVNEPPKSRLKFSPHSRNNANESTIQAECASELYRNFMSKLNVLLYVYQISNLSLNSRPLYTALDGSSQSTGFLG